jgi:serine protease Do
MEFNNQSQYQYPYPDGRRRRRGLGGFGITVIVLVFVLVVLLALVIALRGGGAYDPEVSTATPTPEAGLPGATEPPVSVATPLPGGHEMPALDGVPPDLADVPQFFLNNPIPDIFDAVSDSVVGVVNYTTQQIGRRRMLAIYGSGSGFIVSSEGYILTNAHVIEDAEEITVLLANGEEVEAALIGFDEETDVAVLKVEHEGLVPMALGDSDAVRVGEFVVAIGNPLDTSSLANTTTFGVISAHAREITIDGHTNTYLQTDAAINFGNSGGPLLNMNGEVIGMNSAKSITAGYDEYGNMVSAEGIGFALPINAVREIMELLVTEGHIERPAVGISVLTLTEVIAAELDLPVSSGVYVDSVVAGGPASQAGVLAGDVIISANGQALTDRSEFMEIIEASHIGDTIAVEVYRNGETLRLDIVLGDKGAMDYEIVDPQQ